MNRTHMNNLRLGHFGGGHEVNPIKEKHVLDVSDVDIDGPIKNILRPDISP